ncbi:MAG: excinuclease ABC subunit UvrC [Oscillospiraceae bacterium]|nr:excinuclease ABC subunit UvrC [Oscillospiraceae bacterium]
MTRDELREKANDLPLVPGVYLMMDKTGKVIYVGKAKKLRNRVSQYFQDSAAHNLKTKLMVSQVDRFDTIFVSSEFEALVLENSLIKQHMPHYNILLKDDKGYPFVRLDVKAEYPRFTLVNKTAEDGAKYFGPFGGRQETRMALDAVRAAFKLPTCSKQFPRDLDKERPCLNHHMGKCDGFCRSAMTAEEYRGRIHQAVMLLEGRYKQLTRSMEEEMARLAEDLRFEEAALLRDRIRAIETLGKKQKVIAGICADTDVWGIYRGEVKSGYAVLHVEDGQLTYRETELFSAMVEESPSELLAAVTAQYYLPRGAMPREILLPCEMEGSEELARVLSDRSGRKVTVRVPQRGEKAELLRMAERNAREEVERATTEAERTDKTLALLAKMCSLSAPPRRMEAYDISNTGKSDIVASMTVFQGTRPLKRDYRKFKIKSLADHPDDYSSMREVLTRRFRRYLEGDEKFNALPDLLLIDGGATHADVARGVLRELGLSVPIFGMVKDDRHRTRALITADGEEIGIQANQSVFSLIGRIQEETHRFAITFHHESHGKSTVRSGLDKIPGVGQTRRKALLGRFKSIRAIKEATVGELSSVVPKNVAQAVYDYYHSEKKAQEDETVS